MIVNIFIVFAVMTAASAGNQGVESGLMTILAEERKELTKERKEIGKIFRGETERLRQQDDQLRGKLDKLQEKLDEQHERNEKLRQEDDKLRGNFHLKLEKLKEQNEKQQAQIVKLQKENKVLRRANSKINKVIRQRDPNNTREFDANIKNSIRQNDLTFELKKMMRAEIKNFLITEKICVSGSDLAIGWGGLGEKSVEFQHTFPRKPTVFAALSVVRTDPGKEVYAQAKVRSVSNSSAVIYIYNFKFTFSYVNWMACL